MQRIIGIRRRTFVRALRIILGRYTYLCTTVKVSYGSNGVTNKIIDCFQEQKLRGVTRGGVRVVNLYKTEKKETGKLHKKTKVSLI